MERVEKKNPLLTTRTAIRVSIRALDNGIPQAARLQIQALSEEMSPRVARQVLFGLMAHDMVKLEERITKEHN